MVSLQKVINKMEPGMYVALSNMEKFSTIGGKILNVEEQYIKLSIDGKSKIITDFEPYKVLSLVDKDSQDIIKTRLKNIEELCFGGSDIRTVKVFRNILAIWRLFDEDDREEFSTVLADKMDADAVCDIMDDLVARQDKIVELMGVKVAE